MRVVSVLYNRDEECWWAESAEAPGYRAVGGSLAEVRRLAREGLPFFLEEPVLIREIGIPVMASPAPQRSPKIRQHAEVLRKTASAARRVLA